MRMIVLTLGLLSVLAGPAFAVCEGEPDMADCCARYHIKAPNQPCP